MACGRAIRRASGPLVLLGVAMAVAMPAAATTVNGTLTISSELGREAESRSKERAGPMKLYYWRVPNGAIPTVDPVVAPARDLVVVLEPTSGQAGAPAGETRTIEIKGSRLEPSVVAVTPRTKVRFSNQDPFVHELVCAENPSMAQVPPVPPERGIGDFSFDQPGVYEIRDRRMPHLVGHVVVVSTPLSANPQPTDQPGGASFSFQDVQPGAYALKVFFDGRWVAEQPVVIEEGQNEIGVQVRVPSDAAQHEQPAAAPAEGTPPQPPAAPPTGPARGPAALPPPAPPAAAAPGTPAPPPQGGP